MKDSELNTIWNKFSAELLNFIKAKVNDAYEAEDILQEVFIKIYRNIEHLNDEAKLTSWLYTITNNTIIDYYRRRKGSAVQIEKVEGVLEREAESTNMNDEMLTCLRLFLYQLPDKYKEPLEMYQFKGMNHREISEKLNISLSGSKTRIQRAREKLREILTECCEIEFDTYGNIVEYKPKESYRCSQDNCQ